MGGLVGYREDLIARLTRGLVRGWDRVALEQELSDLVFTDVRIKGEKPDAVVEIAFHHDAYPGVVFGYRFPAYDNEGDPDEWSGESWASVVIANLAEAVLETELGDLTGRRPGAPVVWIA